MYLYSFTKFAWPDKVLILPKWNIFCKKWKSWDLVRFGEDVFICLGKEISFAEQYTYTYAPKVACEVLHKWLLSEKTVSLIHWMVYTYYSTYKSVMKYFVTDERETLLKKEVKIAKKNQKGQTLMVFPDLRTILNRIDEKVLEDKEVAFLTSTSTQSQKDKQRWAIKKGNIDLIIASPSEIFQDFFDLKKIIFIDPHKWYYASQQDPRYKVGAVLEKMKELYGAELDPEVSRARVEGV